MHPVAKDIMTISRIVIVPEFQGFGIGIKFMNEVANLYSDRMRITTSLKPFILALKKNKEWKCVRFGRNSEYQGIKYVGSNNRITATFQRIKNGQTS